MSESLTMHPYQLNSLRFRRLLAAMVTLPPFDEVPYECNGLAVCHSIGDVPVLRLWWWRCVKRELRAHLPQAMVVQLQAQGLVGALPLGRAIDLRRGQPMLTMQLPSAVGPAPAATVLALTQVCLRQEGWGPGLGLELLMQGEGVLPAKLQHAIAARFEAAQLHAPLFDRLGPNLWSISCAWCDGLLQPKGTTLGEVGAWAQDARWRWLSMWRC